MRRFLALVGGLMLLAGEGRLARATQPEVEGPLQVLRAYLPPFRARPFYLPAFGSSQRPSLSPRGQSIAVLADYPRAYWAYTPAYLVLVDTATEAFRSLTLGLFVGVGPPTWGQTEDALLFRSHHYEGPPRTDLERARRQGPFLWKLNTRTGALFPLAMPPLPAAHKGVAVEFTGPILPRPLSNDFLVLVAYQRGSSREPQPDRPYVIYRGRWGESALEDLGEGTSPVWSPDGQMIAFDLDDEVWVMRADGSNRRRLLGDQEETQLLEQLDEVRSGDILRPVWLPGREAILNIFRCSSHKASREGCRLCTQTACWITDVNTGESTLVFEKEKIWDIYPSRDGMHWLVETADRREGLEHRVKFNYYLLDFEG